MTPPLAPPSPIHDFTIYKQPRALITPSLRGRAAAVAIHLSFATKRKDGLRRRFAPRNDGVDRAQGQAPLTVLYSHLNAKGNRMPNSELPTNEIVAKALLHHLHLRAKPVTPQEIYGPLADSLKLTSYQLSLKRNTVYASKWENRVQAAREHLKTKGLLEGKRRGFWSLTPAGHVEAINQEKLDVRFRELDKEFGIDWDE